MYQLLFGPTSIRSFVRQDFILGRGIKLGHVAMHKLVVFAKKDYRAYLDFVKTIHRVKQACPFRTLSIDKYENLKHIKFSELPLEFFSEQIQGLTLDLTDLDRKLILFQKKQDEFREWARRGVVQPYRSIVETTPEEIERVQHLIGILPAMAKALEDYKRNPQSSVDGVFELIDARKKELGILNVNFYRPLADGTWRLTQQTRQWAFVPSKYLNGAPAGKTIGSILQRPEVVFEVDIADLEKAIKDNFDMTVEAFAALVKNKQGVEHLTELPEDVSQWKVDVSSLLSLPSFEKAGIIPNLRSILNDFFSSKGPTRYLFVKLVSEYGIEGIIHLHNRVKKEEPIDPPLLLPKQAVIIQSIKIELVQYFQEVVRAIEYIRRRKAQAKIAAAHEEGAPAPVLEGYSAQDEAKLSRSPRLLPDSQLVSVRIRDKRTINFEVISLPNGTSIAKHLKDNRLFHQLSALRQDCRIVSALSTEVNKDDSVDKYIDSANLWIIARDPDTNKFIGYLAAQPFVASNIPAVYIWANYCLSDFHHLGLGTALGAKGVMVAKQMLNLPKRSRIRGLYRTWNPAVYKMTEKRGFDMFPFPNLDGSGVQREPTPVENRLFTVAAQDILHTSIDVNTGILKGRVIPAKKINWLGKPRVDDFFKNVVKVMDGGALLITSTFPRFFEYLHPLREWSIRFGIILKLVLRGIPLIGGLFKAKANKVDWGKYFEAYDVLNEMRPYQDLLLRVVDLLELTPDANCLDIGSGTGNMSMAIKKAGVKVIGVDSSEGGMALHRKKDPDAVLYNVDLDQTDTGFLPFGDGEFDRISANHVVNYVKNRKVLYQELKRVLKPNGLVVVSVLKKGFNPLQVLLGHMKQLFGEKRGSLGILGSIRAVYANFNLLHPRLREVGEANKVIVDSAAGGNYDLLTKAQIIKEWEEAGFEVLLIEPNYAGQDHVVVLRPKKASHK